MPLQSSNVPSAPEAYSLIRVNAVGWKSQLNQALISLQNGVTSDFIFRMLDQMVAMISSLNTWKEVSGLDTYATAQGYTGSISSDSDAVITSTNNCIAWVVANFPTSSGGYLQSHILNSDGTRTPRSLSSANTAVLQTYLSALIATIT